MGPQQTKNSANKAVGQESLKHVPAKDMVEKTVDANNDKEFFIRNVFETDVKKGYDLLFRHYYAPLCSHAVRYVYSKEVAEDIVADAFFAFWKKSAHENITTSFRAYLFISVRNKCLTFLKWEMNKENSEELEAYDLVSSHSQPDKLMEFDELYLNIEKIINTLPPQNQKVFLMSRFEGKSYQEIADKLQISKKAVEAHISKALTEFRKALKSPAIILLAGLSGLL